MKGWRLPPGAVIVSRPTKWGNPYLVNVRPPLLPPNMPWGRQEAVDAFELMVTGGWQLKRPPGWQILNSIHELEGKDLCCWCPIVDSRGGRVPCHGDLLLKWANAVVLPNGEVGP